MYLIEFPSYLQVAEDCQSHAIGKDGQAHNAGFDAFMTGICFITMVKTLGKLSSCYMFLKEVSLILYTTS